MENTKSTMNAVPRMSDEDLKKFVIEYCNGNVFSSAHIEQFGYKDDPNMYGMVFMPLLFGGLSDLPKEEIDNIGLIWEYYSEAGPRAINGMPMFTSCSIMHKDDWKRALGAIKKELERREEIEV